MSNSKELFPIIGIGRQCDLSSDGIPHVASSGYTIEELEIIQNAGCNIAFGGFEWGGAEESNRFKNYFDSLEAAKEVGMKLIVKIPFWRITGEEINNDISYCDLSKNDKLKQRLGYWRDEWKNFIKQFNSSEFNVRNTNNPNNTDNPNNVVKAWFLADEPSESEFEYLKLCKNTIMNLNSKYPVVANLYPSYANKKQLLGVCKSSDLSGNSLYQSYLDNFENIFSPQIWLADFYPFVEKDVKNDNTPVLYGKFLLFNHSIAAKAYSQQVPFWAYCPTVHYEGRNENNEVTFRFPEPTLALMKYSVYIPIAFGAQGILYWNLFQGNKNELLAPIMFNGKPSKILRPLRILNQEIRKYQDVFNGCKSKPTVREFVGPTSKESNQIYPLISDKYRLKYIDYDKTISSDTKGFIISQLVNEIDEILTTFYIIVNLDYENSQRISISFTTDVVDMMASYPDIPLLPGEVNPVNDDIGFEPINPIREFNGTLAPSDWRIFRVKKTT